MTQVTSPQREAAERATPTIDWSLLSPQGRVIFYVALCPACTATEIAMALGMTERGVRFLLRDLIRNDSLLVEERGRRHHYRINLDAPLLHPTIQGLTLEPVLGKLVEEAEREGNAICDPDQASAERTDRPTNGG
ncbi:MAG TPA: hypothetical protein VMR52_06370 [Dehalococcoidia bacterium]|nr:hypothetical protein [Dehalococcoidia bacterium]